MARGKDEAGIRQVIYHVGARYLSNSASVGPYFTYLAGFGHEANAPSVVWGSVPPCIKQAREMMETFGQKHAAVENFRVESLTALGWHSQGSKKVSQNDI
jgi:hypothetical protein